MNRDELNKKMSETFEGLGRSDMFSNLLRRMEGECFLLLYIWNAEGKTTPGKLAEQLNVSAARIAAILRSLEKKKLIIRENDGEDKRRVYVYLTAAGIKYARKLAEEVNSRSKKLVEVLGEEDSMHFLRITKKIISYEISVNAGKQGTDEHDDKNRNIIQNEQDKRGDCSE